MTVMNPPFTYIFLNHYLSQSFSSRCPISSIVLWFERTGQTWYPIQTTTFLPMTAVMESLLPVQAQVKYNLPAGVPSRQPLKC